MDSAGKRTLRGFLSASLVLCALCAVFVTCSIWVAQSGQDSIHPAESGLIMTSSTSVATRVLTMNRTEFTERFGSTDLTGALCGYTRKDDTGAVLTLLCHARPRRVLEIGTALGHMTANLTRWTDEEARIFTMDLIRGMARAAVGAAEQRVDEPGPASGAFSRIISARPTRRSSSRPTR